MNGVLDSKRLPRAFTGFDKMTSNQLRYHVLGPFGGATVLWKWRATVQAQTIGEVHISASLGQTPEAGIAGFEAGVALIDFSDTRIGKHPAIVVRGATNFLYYELGFEVFRPLQTGANYVHFAVKNLLLSNVRVVLGAVVLRMEDVEALRGARTE